MTACSLCLALALGSLIGNEARVVLDRRSQLHIEVNKTALRGAPPSASTNAQPWASNSGLKCVGWRTTLTCVPSGPRDPLSDKDCLTIIGSQESGFCECEGYVHTAAVPCGHDPVNCTNECGVLQKLHREVFGAGFPVDGSDMEEAMSGGGVPDGAIMQGIGSGKDPYAEALKYGNRAVADVNKAVSHSNKLLDSARGMISKMMSLKPWAEITKMGKDAEEAGKQTQELAKLARPFIYTQVNETQN